MAKAHKSTGKALSANFNEKEFMCSHCGMVHVETTLIEKLEKLRKLAGRSIHINSGYRCPAHNSKIGGTSQSYHMKGMAADIVIQGLNPRQVAALAQKAGFGGIGSYADFTHVDVGPPRRWKG